ncbi:MAG TPA: phosphatase PAP2 family protein, partial [Thermoleophilia bacterium]|nr:phosphatase PAP2 family protein [Thermoleophilia bacterium]
FQIMLRTERLAPLLVTLTWAGIALLAALLLGAPPGVTVALSVAFVNGMVLLSITYWWKISFHTATLAASVLVLAQQFGQVALLGLLLVAAVGWSRVRLGRHTVAQVLAGTAVSLLVTSAALAFLTARNM